MKQWVVFKCLAGPTNSPTLTDEIVTGGTPGPCLSRVKGLLSELDAVQSMIFVPDGKRRTGLGQAQYIMATKRWMAGSDVRVHTSVGNMPNY